MSDILSTQYSEDLPEQSASIADLMAGFKRRRKPIMYTGVAVFMLALLTALFWPPTYRASATILIEEQEVPEDLVRSTVTSYADQQIEVIRQRVLTLQNIMDMVEKFELYDAGELAKMPRTLVTSEFIEALNLEVIQAAVIDPRSGRPTEATIAFTLGFEGSSPKKTQQVVNELVNLFLNENLRSRSEQTGSTSDFLREQANQLAVEMRNYETALVEFKAQYQAALPESFQLNMQNLTRYQSQLISSEARLIELNRRQLEVQGQLASMSPYAPQILPSGEAVMADVDRLKSLESQYREQSARYSENHPNVAKLRREVAALKKHVGGSVDDSNELRRILETQRDELTRLEATYSLTHPEVVTQKQRVEKLREQLASAVDSQAEINADNPAYVVMDNQLQMLMMEKNALRNNVSSTSEQIETLNQAATQAPAVEREYSNLLRNLDVATNNYLALQAKLQQAELASDLESNRKGQRFTLIEPPVLPEQPVSPNRPAILFLGIILAAGAGLGVGVLLEATDQSIRSAGSLQSVIGYMPLVTIPYITTPKEDARDKPSRTPYIIALGLGTTGLLVMLLLIHFFYKPLDVLWYVVLTKLGIG
jgi:succinoglycan biosynthesis transport protein ExoP